MYWRSNSATASPLWTNEPAGATCCSTSVKSFELSPVGAPGSESAVLPSPVEPIVVDVAAALPLEDVTALELPRSVPPNRVVALVNALEAFGAALDAAVAELLAVDELVEAAVVADGLVVLRP